jgi:hypothetical protein
LESRIEDQKEKTRQRRRNGLKNCNGKKKPVLLTNECDDRESVPDDLESVREHPVEPKKVPGQRLVHCFVYRCTDLGLPGRTFRGRQRERDRGQTETLVS